MKVYVNGAEEKLQAFFNQKITAEELEAWVLEKHPGKWDKLKNIIYGCEMSNNI